jgi:type IV secretion system protein VirB11
MNAETKFAERHLTMLMTALGDDIAKHMSEDDILEIMVNPDGKLWVESLTKGKYFTKIVLSAKQTANVIKLVAAYRHGVADDKHPEVSCELPQSGARFEGWLPPVVSEPAFTIRKKAVNIFTLEDYVSAKSLKEEQAAFLKEAVLNRRNILIAGGTASGKTTFANALLHELKSSPDRVIILEDLPELQVDMQDSVCLRTCETVPMRELVKGILRMRPDRIIIGEVRDGAALELLKAWNTGHPGGICTIHANSPQATLSRLEDLVQEVVSVLPTRLIRQAVDIIVFMRRDSEGHYLIDSVDCLDDFVEGKYILKPFSGVK